MVFYPVNTFLNRKAKSGVGKVVETELAQSFVGIFPINNKGVSALAWCNMLQSHLVVTKAKSSDFSFRYSEILLQQIILKSQRMLVSKVG